LGKVIKKNKKTTNDDAHLSMKETKHPPFVKKNKERGRSGGICRGKQHENKREKEKHKRKTGKKKQGRPIELGDPSPASSDNCF